MVAAADLASRLGLAGKTVVERIRNLVQGAGLPAELPAHSTTALIHAMRQDKKVKDRRIHFVLPTQIGKVTVVPIGEADLRAFLREEALAAHRRRPTRT